MSYYLFLDDVRSVQDVRSYLALPNIPDDSWVIVRSHDQFVQTITDRGIPTFVTFDHDLAPEHYGDGFPDRPKVDYTTYRYKTGMDCCKHLVEQCINENRPFPQYTVHSWNPVGSRNIISYITSFNNSRNNHVD